MSNPFSTRFTRPGAIPYFFPDSTQMDVGRLTDRLIACRCQGQVCGSHGTGKSTLLMEIERELTRREHAVVRVRSPESQRGTLMRHLWQARATVFVDGFERLHGWERELVISLARYRGSGLLVTCHRRCRLPLLWETEVPLTTAHAVVRYLTQTSRPARAIATKQLARQLTARRGDLRETLFDLYDLCQDQGCLITSGG